MVFSHRLPNALFQSTGAIGLAARYQLPRLSGTNYASNLSVNGIPDISLLRNHHFALPANPAITARSRSFETLTLYLHQYLTNRLPPPIK